MRFSKIKDNDIANGVGITMSLWTQGCPHHCKGCFNFETWDFNGGKEFTTEDLKYILNNIDKNNIKRNLAILGGEPLCPENVKGVIELCKQFKKVYPEKMIYLWTGYEVENFDYTQMKIFEYIDVLVDGKFNYSKSNGDLIFKGDATQRVIDVQKSLENNQVILWENDNEVY